MNKTERPVQVGRFRRKAVAMGEGSALRFRGIPGQERPLDRGSCEGPRYARGFIRGAYTVLALTALLFSVLALQTSVSAGFDLLACFDEAKGDNSRCWAGPYTGSIRAAQLVGDEEAVQLGVDIARSAKLCADGDSTAACLAKLDAISGWPFEEAKREAEKRVPGARQCFLYRTEALRQARAANDSARMRLIGVYRPCCAEQERWDRDPTGDTLSKFMDRPDCPERLPTPRMDAKVIASTTQSVDWAGLAAWIPFTVAKLLFVFFTVRAIIRRTPYGMWWRRSWPKVLIIFGTGLGASEVFGLLDRIHVYPRPSPSVFALSAVMIVAGALNLRRPITSAGAKDKPSAREIEELHVQK
jgi:hypothetical protein